MKINLYNQYKAEQMRYKIFVPLLRYFGFSMLGLYLYLLFAVKGLDTKYFLLNIYAIYCNSSVMILFQFYKIPTLFKNLISENENLTHESYRIIDSNRTEIYLPFLKELYGRNFTEEQLNYNLKDMQSLIISLGRLNWEKISRIYFFVFFLVSFLLFYWLYPLETN